MIIDVQIWCVTNFTRMPQQQWRLIFQRNSLCKSKEEIRVWTLRLKEEVSEIESEIRVSVGKVKEDMRQ